MDTRPLSNAHPVFDDEAETTVHDRAALEGDGEVATCRAPEKVRGLAVIEIGPASEAPAARGDVDAVAVPSARVVIAAEASYEADVGDRPTVPSAEMVVVPKPAPAPELVAAPVAPPVAPRIQPMAPAAEFTPGAMAIELPPAIRARYQRDLPPASGLRGPNRAGFLLAAASLLVTLVIAALLVVPRKGELRVALSVERGTVERADIFVDGQKRCEVAPCVVRELTPGSHAVSVQAPGFEPSGTVYEKVDAGRERLAFVAMRPDSHARAGVKAASDQAGVRVIVDGVDRGALPLEVADLAPGPHQVRFDGGADRVASEETIRVRAGEVRDFGRVSLSPRAPQPVRAQ